MKGFEGISRPTVAKKIGAETFDTKQANFISQSKRYEATPVVTYSEVVERLNEEEKRGKADVMQGITALAIEITDIIGDGVVTPEEIKRVLPQADKLLLEIEACFEQASVDEKNIISEDVEIIKRFVKIYTPEASTRSLH